MIHLPPCCANPYVWDPEAGWQPDSHGTILGFHIYIVTTPGANATRRFRTTWLQLLASNSEIGLSGKSSERERANGKGLKLYNTSYRVLGLKFVPQNS